MLNDLQHTSLIKAWIMPPMNSGDMERFQ